MPARVVHHGPKTAWLIGCLYGVIVLACGGCEPGMGITEVEVAIEDGAVVIRNITAGAEAAVRCRGVEAPCLVTVDPGTGDWSDEKTYGDLQQAIVRAPAGATLTVTGRCPGPVRIEERMDLAIRGVSAADDGHCPLEAGADRVEMEGDVQELAATVFGGDGEVITVTRSSGITIERLNIVDGDGTGVTLKKGVGNEVFCNCVARNDDGGIDMDREQGSVVARNIVAANGDDGILLEGGHGNLVFGNSVVENGDDGVAIELSAGNTLDGNVLTGNDEDGLDLDLADNNVIVGNVVMGNGTDPPDDRGVELGYSDGNEVDANSIADNADGSSVVGCEWSSGNFGSDVPPACE